VPSKRICFKTNLNFPAQKVFSWHNQHGAFARLLPPWEKIKVLSHPGEIRDGSEVKLKCFVAGPFYFNWHLRHSDFSQNQSFSDTQISGPFKKYKHQHLFSENASSTQLNDKIEYELPFSPITKYLGKFFLEDRLSRTFYYRDQILKNDLSFHTEFADKSKLKFLITGASGLIGKALISFLETAGHQVNTVVRNPSKIGPSSVFFSGEEFKFKPDDHFDCIINLAGAGIADQRWSQSRKKEIYESRIQYTEKLIDSLRKLNVAPKTLISCSGLSFYKEHENAANTEESPKGQGFLSDVANAWEQAAERSSSLGVRVCTLRLGVILDPRGGSLKKMLPAFNFGLGAKLGSGEQMFSWVSLEDVIRAILFLAYKEELSGAFNLCSPNPTSNSTFTNTLARVLARPAFFKAPVQMLNLIFGEMASETMLASINCAPNKLLHSGFKFIFPELEVCLNYCLGKNKKAYE
jgi:uncharacterized protein (TIGR01777 family)